MESKKKLSRVSILLIIELVIMIIMSTVVYQIVSSATRKNSIEHMQTVANERAHIIETYVKNAEKTLEYYSKADQVTNLLKYVTENGLNGADTQSYIDKAYDYTLDYSADIENLEGIYVSEWNTHVLAQTNFKYPDVDMTTRTDEGPLKELHDGMAAAGDGVFDTGMIISPASGKQIVSMYKAVYDENGNPIGLVGLGIYTQGLIDALNKLEIQGINDASYSMVNVSDSKYVFNEDSKLVGTLADNGEIQSICESLKDKHTGQTGSFEYKNDGTPYISNYSFIPEYGWILMINDTKSEVYSLTNIMSIYMAVFAVLIVALIAVFAFISKKQEQTNKKLASTIIKNDKTKQSLYTAMFKDVLTDVRNRIAFSMDFDEKKLTQNDCHYFVMYNINEFSKINSQYGNDIGDWLLVKSVEVIGQVFSNGTVYRTGSDEFVVSIPIENSNIESSDIISDAQIALNRLMAQHTSPAGRLSFNFQASVAKKNGTINSSVITALKDMIAKSNDGSGDYIGFVDLNR